nr:annexin [Hymenolepis microstoma]
MTTDFDPTADAMALDKAMKGLGTDEQAIIDILANRTIKQRKKIAKRYKASFGRDLQQSLSKETSGKFRKVVQMSFLDRAHLNAKALFKAMDGLGTKESVIIQVLCTASNQEIAELRDAYERVLLEKNENPLRHDIEKDVISDLSGDFEKFIVAILQGAREEALDRDAAVADVEALYSAGEKKTGTDEEVFTRIFARNSYATLRAMDELYFEKAGHGLLKAIASELSGDYEKAITTVVKTAFKREECIADLLHETMAGAGTKDEQLMRLVLAYSEDNMKEIKAIFMAKYNKSLEERIHSDTSGDYRKFLIALISRY